MAKDPSKTEQATPKRIKKAREEGNVAKSQELSKLISIIAGLVILSLWVSTMAKTFMGLFRHFMTESVYFEPTTSNILALGLWLAQEIAFLLLPILFFVAATAYITLRVQVGKLWTTKVFKPKLSKFNPLKGIKRMFFSLQTFVRLGKSILQALVIGFAAWLVIRDEMSSFLSLYYTDAAGVAVRILTVGSRIIYYTLIPMGCIALFDWWFTRHQYNENLKMSKDEVKDEHKQSEGDPLVRAQMRKKMMQMSMNSAIKNTTKADVVITNPTHIAVALQYNPQQYPAPVIVAMGANKVAEKIKDIAKENNIPIKENKPLARALYKQSEVGDMIPADLFQAVAAILAEIWKTKPGQDTSDPGKNSSGGQTIDF